MKNSQYNYFVKFAPDNVTIAYNCISGGMLVFDEKKSNVVDIVLNSPDSKFEGEEATIKDALVENRFLIDDNIDEIRLLKMRNSLSRFNQNELALVIAPDLSCPLSCPYCYVDRSKVSISKEIQNSLKQLVKKRIEKASNLSVSWTGGEPLLAIDSLSELNIFFRDLCIEKNKPYDLHMVTNAVLLTPEMVDRLIRCGINILQVTIDGTEEFHDRFRRTKAGKGTFKTILANIVYASNNGLKIVVRSNIEKSNYESIFKLIDQLAASGLNLQNSMFFPCKVSDMGDDNSDSHSLNTFTSEEFARIEPGILLHALKNGFKMSPSRLKTRHSYCGANTSPLLVVDPHGNVLKCWCHLGKAKNNLIGKLKEEGTVEYTNIDNLSRWLTWDPFDNPKCKKCKVLPLCMGGCMYHNVMEQTDEIGRGCTEIRYNLEEILILYYLNSSKTQEQLKRINKIGHIQ